MKNNLPILKGSATFFSFYILNTILRLLSSILVARTVGAEGKGIYTLLVLSNAFVVILLNPGFNTAISYFAAREQSIGKLLLRFSLLSAIIMGFCGGALVFLTYQIVLRENILQNIPAAYILSVLAATPFSLFTLYGTAILLGRRKIYEFNIAESTRLGCILILQACFIFLGLGVQGIIIAFVSGILFSTLVTAWFLYIEFKPAFLQGEQPIKPIIAYGIKSYPTNLLSFVNYRLDAFLVNLYTNSSQVGLYATSASLAEMLWMVPNAVSNTLFVQISRSGNKDANQLTERVIRMTALVMVISIMIAIFIGPILIPFLFGRPFKGSIIPFLLLLPGVLGVGINRLITADLNGRGKPQYASYATGISAMVTVILNVLLIPAIGITGAAIASSSAYLTSAFLLVIWFMKETRTHWKYLLIPQKQDFQSVIEIFRQEIQKWNNYREAK